MAGTPMAQVASEINKSQFLRDYRKSNARTICEKYNLSAARFYALLKFWNIPTNSELKEMSSDTQEVEKTKWDLPAVFTYGGANANPNGESRAFIEGMLTALQVIRDRLD